MLIAESTVALIVVVPLLVGILIGFALGRFGVNQIKESLGLMHTQLALLSRKIEDIKESPVFPVQDYRPAPANLL